MKWAYIFLGTCFFIFVASLFFTPMEPDKTDFSPQGQITIGQNIFNVAIADTPDLIKKGLSGKTNLKPNEGTFFIFQEAGNYGFWMKDMLFPLDIIWISSDFTINHIEKNVLPETFPKIFYPKENSLYVLEIPAFGSDKFDIKIGDKVIFTKQ